MSPTHPPCSNLFSSREKLHNQIILKATPTNFHCEIFPQAPTQTTLFVLLGTLMFLHAAHADDFTEISLHNEDALAESSVVRNWTLLCEQLCR